VAEEQAFIVGTGNGQPTGIFHAANGAHIGATAAGATAIAFDDVVNLIHSLKSPYRRNAAFLTHDATVSAMRKLKDTNGQFLWQPSLQAGQPDKLFGYPLHTSPYGPTIKAAALTVAFGAFSNYWIADRQGRTLQRLNELYAGNGQVGFLITERLDGKVILAEGIQLLKQAGT
jgi:HK97 family phage major capsid protein